MLSAVMKNDIVLSHFIAMLSVVMLKYIMLPVTFYSHAECRYAEIHYGNS
jgi:hypothetical protein